MPRCFLLTACLVLCSLAPAAGAEEPLHRQIDRLIEQQAGGVPLAPRTTDAEFVRRIYLDLAGRIPTAAETRKFLAEEADDKRLQLVEELLARPDYARHMRERFHAMLMERRGDDGEWLKFLQTAFAANMPWDQMARAIIHPNADDEATRGAAYFYTARLVSEGAMAPVDVPGLARDAGRLLAGVDLQCAQCHDHLTIEDYHQQDFQGLLMVFENIQIRRDVSFPAVAENLMTKPKEFMSVFLQEPQTTAPRVPGGGEIPIAVYPEGEEYVVAPNRKEKIVGIPKFSPLTELATGLASRENLNFRRNIANRMWFLAMGRGLVEPLDLHHSDNPASHPELLELLAAELAEHDFDLKYLLREIVFSEAYGRATHGSEEASAAEATFAAALEKPLSAEQLFWSTLVATESIEAASLDAKSDLEAIVSGNNDLEKLQELFIKTFANPPQEPEVDFEPTVKAALFLMHDSSFQKLLERREGNLIDRLSAIDDPAHCVEELFLAIFSRLPSDEERVELAELVSQAEQKTAVLQHLAWAMLASTEFCLNH